MSLNVFFKYGYLFFTIIAILSINTSLGQDASPQKEVVKEWLPVPFGTIVKMKIQIVDRDELQTHSFKCYPEFLFKILSVDTIVLAKPIIVEFEESSDFPNNIFTLFKHLYGKDTGRIASDLSRNMKKEYVGKEFNINGYESGAFRGIPADLNKYTVPPQGCGFGFRHYIVLVSKMTIVSH